MAPSSHNNALYSPYGAYELKAKYQRNLLFGTLSTAGFIALILIVAWVISALGSEDAINVQPHVIKTVAELGPPPTIAKKPPQVKVKQNIAVPKVGIPKPVADEDVLDEDVTLATREELAEIVAPDPTATSGDGDIVVDIEDEDYLPAMGEFVPVENPAEMVYQETPVYPRLAKQAGLEGAVWVNALVTKDGIVKKAAVAKSSGTESLDQAAVAAAYKCKYKPAIQNGRPVAMWVTYKVVFSLNQ